MIGPSDNGWLMRMARPIAAVTGFSLLVIGQSALADEAADQRCAKGPDVRRIEIRFADDAGSLPCRVIYRPEVESDTVGTSSWPESTDLAVCETQADDVVERLSSEGWTCAVLGDAAIDDADDVLPLVQQETAAVIEAEGTGSDGTAPSASPAEVFLSPPLDGGDRGAVTGERDEPASFVVNPELPPPSPDLTSMIQDDLRRLDTTLDGLLEAEIAGYGDLNADDIEDALVLYTYNSPQPAYRQFLAAYMFDGELYQLTATRPVGGNVSASRDARIETIDQGVVHLSLRAFEPGDPSCCPSGTRHVALTLRDLDLVEIDADSPTR